MQFCRFSYTSVLSRSYSTLTTPDNDQKITRRHPSRSAVVVFVHAIRKRSKKWHVFVPLDGFPWFNHLFELLDNTRLEPSSVILGRMVEIGCEAPRHQYIELLIHTYTACILENEIHTTENEMHTTDTPILVLCISLGSSFLFMDFISSLHAL